ncbi:CBM20 domain-containing protein [Chloropicon primus]|nr:hypothetical protein A3770_09p55320 [Chloropicon primus]UPR02231.1 CBM20 domain-containing protein [Chloropicon primus]|eukprot:QDZ23014.1 hypothetical protein A3770_09p55320 [Chloropicon primus]
MPKVEASTSSVASSMARGESKVRILFTTEYVCGVGEELFVVGEDHALGIWNHTRGVPFRNVGGTPGYTESSWQASVKLNKGESYEFKLIAVRDGGRFVRWQHGSNRVINIPRDVPTNCGYAAFVPWEGHTSVSQVADTLEYDALDSLESLQRKVEGDSPGPVQASDLKKGILQKLEPAEDVLSEANSRAVDSAVTELNQSIDDAESSDLDPTSLGSLEHDMEVAAASRRVVITMELMQEQELRKQLTSGAVDEEEDGLLGKDFN